MVAEGVNGRSVIDIAAVQDALREDRIDGWLLYDFRGLNPIAADVTGVARQGGHLATRRWFYLIPADGSPRGLVHAIEPHTLAHLPGTAERYAGRGQLETGLRQLLSGMRRLAMEYSPHGSIPYVSRVDGGTLELVRDCGVDVVSSGDLVQRFSAVWSDEAIASHLAASAALYRIKDRAFETIARRLADGIDTTEYDIQQLMSGWFREERLVTDSDRGAARHRLGSECICAGECGKPTLPADRGGQPPHCAQRARAPRSVGETRPPRVGLRRHHLGRLYRRRRPGAFCGGVFSRRGGA
jgi:hypothetical protein